MKKMEENLTILRRCSLFAGLSDTQTAALLQSLHPVRRSFSKGEVLLLAGYETQELGVVLCGQIEAEKQTADGVTLTLTRMGPGGIFADVGGQPGSKKPGDRDGRNGRDGTAHPLQKPAAAGRSAGRRPRGSAAKPRGGHGKQEILRAGPAGGASDAAFAAGRVLRYLRTEALRRAALCARRTHPGAGLAAVNEGCGAALCAGSFRACGGTEYYKSTGPCFGFCRASRPVKTAGPCGQTGGKRWNVNIQAV